MDIKKYVKTQCTKDILMMNVLNADIATQLCTMEKLGTLII